MARTITKEDIPESQPLTNAEVLGKFVRTARTNNNLTIHDAAALCNVSVDAMTNIEKAKGDIKLSTILKICKMLGITLRIEA